RQPLMFVKNRLIFIVIAIFYFLILFFSGLNRRVLLAIGCQLSAVSYRLSAIGYRLSAIGYRLSAIGYQLSAIG
ncbi:MAG: hypothetical protein ABIN89_12045, partial [Chitinophagaceae bacterium]